MKIDRLIFAIAINIHTSQINTRGTMNADKISRDSRILSLSPRRQNFIESSNNLDVFKSPARFTRILHHPGKIFLRYRRYLINTLGATRSTTSPKNIIAANMFRDRPPALTPKLASPNRGTRALSLINYVITSSINGIIHHKKS